MLGLLLDRSDPETLRRVLDQPQDKWEAWGYRYPNGAGCFVGIACDIQGEPIRPLAPDLWLTPEDEHRIHRWKVEVDALPLQAQLGTVEDRFDGLMERFGCERIVAAIRARAEASLAAQQDK